MSLLTGLISYWKLDEASGNAADAHGSNTLTNNGTATFAPGKLNNGADLELDSSQFFSIADASQSGLDFSTALSFSLWYKPETEPSPLAVLIGKREQPGNESYYFAHWPGLGGIRLNVDANGDGVTNDSFDFTVTLNDATWYHLVITWDGATKTAKLYVDGSQSGSDIVGSAVSSIYNGAAPFRMGAIDADQYLIDGMLDEVGVWSRVLTSGEVTSLYNSGTPLAYEDFAPPAAGNQKNMLLMGVG